MSYLAKTSSGRQAEYVAIHEAAAGLPALHGAAGLEAEGEAEAAPQGLGVAVEPHQLDVVEDLHVPLVQLALHQILDTLSNRRVL